jgi:hypothetical protein
MSVQVSRKGSEIVVVVSQTSVGAATEVEIPLGIARGRILRHKSYRTGGSGATVNPIIGLATNPAGFNIVLEEDAASFIDNSYAGGGITFSSTGSLFMRSRPDTGSDNAITTVLHVSVGW